MKNLSGTSKYALVAVALVLIVGCKEINVTSGPTKPTCAQIRPGWETSKKSCAEINQILAKYDQSLYRIQRFRKGKLVGERGTLNPSYIPDGTIGEVAKEAKDLKLTGCAIQAGRWHAIPPSLHSSTNPVNIEKSTDLPMLDQVLKNNQ